MKLSTASILGLFLLSSIVLACGGGGGGGGSPTPGLTVTAVNPSGGPVGGGTAITITGTGFQSGATVSVGGSAAANVTVVSDTSITGTTPAGTAGAADITVASGGGSATLTAGFTYGANPPTISGVNPPKGSALGGTQVVIDGTGFDVGTPTVQIGGVPAVNVLPLSSTQIQCNAPGGSPGQVSVIVTTAAGTSGLGAFAYYDPIFVADGGSTPGPLGGSLYALDPLTPGFVEIMGPIGFGVTGMEFASDGTLYGATSLSTAGQPTPTRVLITISPQTGQGTQVGLLTDNAMPVPNNYAIADLTLVGSTLYGSASVGVGGATSIEVLTPGGAPVVTPGFPLLPPVAPIPAPGGALAADAAGTNVYFLSFSASGMLPPAQGALFQVNVVAGTFTALPFLVGSPHPAGVGRITAATFHKSTLYVLDAVPQSGPRDLYTVSTTPPTVGAMTLVLPLPSQNAGAIASPTK